MNLDKTLNLVPVKKPMFQNPVVIRREKLIRSINKQIANVNRVMSGSKPSREWFWINEQGEYFLHIKYGKQVLELGKGKFSIQCSNLDQILESLEIVKTEIIKGSFDKVLTEQSDQIRKNFVKN